MKQRLAIAATLLKDPDLLIFDEPTNGLDPAGIHDIRATMRRLGDEGRTVLVSSHILGEVEQVADTVSIIARGRLLASGTVAEVIGSSLGGGFRVRVSDPVGGLTALRATGWTVRPEADHLVVDGPTDGAEITRLLAGSDVWVSELTPVRADLESVFLEITQAAGIPDSAEPGTPPVSRLVVVELRRLLARRLTRIAAVLALLVVGFTLFGAQQNAYNSTPERVAAQNAENQRQCLEFEKEAQQTDPSADYQCEQSVSSGPATTGPQLAEATTSQVALFLAFIAFVVGAAFVAAEFSTGSIGMWLTFEPRRMRVHASKLLVLLGGSLLVGALLAVVTTSGALLFASHYGLPDAAADVAAAHPWWACLRLVGIVVAAAVLGGAIGFLLRHTAAALGVILGYALVESIARGLFEQRSPRIATWLLLPNTQAWIQGGLPDYSSDQGCFGPNPGDCVTPLLVTVPHAAVYLLVVVVAVVLASALVFRRRDVS